jgi:hypothetical protein
MCVLSHSRWAAYVLVRITARESPIAVVTANAASWMDTISRHITVSFVHWLLILQTDFNETTPHALETLSQVVVRSFEVCFASNPPHRLQNAELRRDLGISAVPSFMKLLNTLLDSGDVEVPLTLPSTHLT